LKPNKYSVLYWPGIRRSEAELHTLFEILRDAEFTVDCVGSIYDIGLLPDNAESDIQQWINDPKNPTSDWWIGLSLGAAVAHIVACTTPESRRPKRLTLINPFADRLELSLQLGFSMSGQWRLKPIEFHSPGGIIVDLIISTRDERIPPDHGQQFKDCYSAVDIAVVELDADHTISKESQQRQLGALLLSRHWLRVTEKGISSTI
jgi:pimeloyl-ACP methyl ester carboxylesterase